MARKIMKKAGIPGSSFHTLRHTFASSLAIAGVDLYRISKLLGHSSIKTTEIYAHLQPSDLIETIKKLPY
ncbi:MAG: Tyrosine recombinase XerD [Elusimicrobia bacterium ADurb.Bin231]|nr:MAG: Tyrosine recombinase XerD [Elusimicrobia bacterium ADurb.Bin231]